MHRHHMCTHGHTLIYKTSRAHREHLGGLLVDALDGGIRGVEELDRSSGLPRQPGPSSLFVPRQAKQPVAVHPGRRGDDLVAVEGEDDENWDLRGEGDERGAQARQLHVAPCGGKVVGAIRAGLGGSLGNLKQGTVDVCAYGMQCATMRTGTGQPQG